MKLTYKMLKQAGACGEGRDWFSEHYPTGGEIGEVYRACPVDWQVWLVGSISEDVMRTLIQAGADVNAQNRSGETALMLAASDDHTAIIEALLNAGADVNAQNCGGTTVSMWAARLGHTETAALLRERGAI